ncbi:MAG TPA: hypothetical protein VIR45_05570 [Kiloniellaceae bacterium]
MQDVGAETLEPGMGNHPFLRHVGRSFPHDHARQLGRGDPLSRGQQLPFPAGLDTGPDAQIARSAAAADRLEKEIPDLVFRQEALEVGTGACPGRAIGKAARHPERAEARRLRNAAVAQVAGKDQLVEDQVGGVRPVDRHLPAPSLEEAEKEGLVLVRHFLTVKPVAVIIGCRQPGREQQAGLLDDAMARPAGRLPSGTDAASSPSRSSTPRWRSDSQSSAIHGDKLPSKSSSRSFVCLAQRLV